MKNLFKSNLVLSACSLCFLLFQVSLAHAMAPSGPGMEGGFGAKTTDATLGMALAGMSPEWIDPEEVKDLFYEGLEESNPEVLESHADLENLSTNRFKALGVEAVDPEQRTHGKMTVGQSFLAATVANLISTSVTYPLELKKLRKQVAHLEKGSLYKGFLPHSVAMCISLGTKYSAYETFRNQAFSPLVSGVAAGIFANGVGSPFWVYRVKKALVSENEPYHLKCFIQDIRKDPTMPFRGQAISVPGTFSHGMYFEIFERLRERLSPTLAHQTGDAWTGGPLAHFSLDFVASAGARILVSTWHFPLETIRVNRQENGKRYGEIIKNLYREGGWKRFYKGYGYSLVKGTFGSAFQMSVYQCLKDKMTCPRH